MTPRRALAALIALTLLPGSGCSYLLVQRAPEPPPERQWTMCTENRAMPVLDVLTAGLLLAPIVYFAGFAPSSSDRTLGLLVTVPLMGLPAAAFGASAVHGFQQTGRCQQLHEAYERGPDPTAPPAPL